MSETEIPTAEELEQMNPEKDTVVTRESTDGYYIEAHVVTGSTVSSNEAFTYTDDFGMYRVTEGRGLATDFDELLREVAADNSVLSGFRRSPHDAFELVVEVRPDTITEVTFDTTNTATIELSPDSSYVNSVDEILSEVQGDVQQD